MTNEEHLQQLIQEGKHAESARFFFEHDDYKENHFREWLKAEYKEDKIDEDE